LTCIFFGSRKFVFPRFSVLTLAKPRESSLSLCMKKKMSGDVVLHSFLQLRLYLGLFLLTLLVLVHVYIKDTVLYHPFSVLRSLVPWAWLTATWLGLTRSNVLAHVVGTEKE